MSEEIVTRDNTTKVETLAAEGFSSSGVPRVYAAIWTRQTSNVLDIRDAVKADTLVAKIEASLLTANGSAQQAKRNGLNILKNY